MNAIDIALLNQFVSSLETYERDKRAVLSRPNLFRDVRKERDLSLREFAKEMGTDFTYLCKIENGEAGISDSMLKKLATFLPKADPA
jgi:ribosome-binding protein aMBF1 (putative translation factor)